MIAGLRFEMRTLLLIAAPVVLTQLAQHGLAFVDTLMVGRLGAGPLAGLALGATGFGLVLVIGSSFMLAVGPHAAQAVGAGDPDEAARALAQSVWLVALVSVPGILLLVNGEALFGLLGQDAEVASDAGAYLRAVVPGLPFALAFAALRSYIEAHGVTRPVTVIAFLGVALNVGANDVLIHGKLGFPALGLVGAGHATALVYLFLAILATLLVASMDGRRVLSRLAPDRRVLRELARVGWPIGLTLGFEVGLFSVTTLLMGRFGEAALAAHQVAMQTASLTFMVPLGIGIAAGIRVGQAAGRRDMLTARSAGRAGIVLSVGFMSVAALTFLLLGRPLVGIYADLGDPANAAMVRLAVTFLALAGVFQIVDGIQVTAAGALRGLKDTRVPMFMTLVAYWFIGLPIGLVSALVLDAGPKGLWFGLIAGLAAAATLLGWRFVRLMDRAVRQVETG